MEKLIFYILSLTYMVFLFIPSSSALFEDQIGKFDWKKEFVGVPNKVMFDTNLSLGKYVVMQTQSNVMACLSAKSGQIIWRRVFAENDGNIVGSHVANGIVVAVTSNGIVYTWEINTGNLLWENNLAADENSFTQLLTAEISVLDLGYTDGKAVLILSNSVFYIIKCPPANDPVTKSFALGTEDNKFMTLFDYKMKEVIIFEFAVNSHIATRVYSLESSEELNTAQVQASWMDNLEKVALLKGGLVVYYSKDTDSFYAVDGKNGNELSNDLSVSVGIDSPVQSLHSICVNDISKLSTNFLVVNSYNVAYTVAYNVESKAFKVVSKFTLPDSPVILSANVGSESYYFNTEKTHNKIKISAFKHGATSFEEDLTLQYSLPEWTGDIADVYVNLFMKQSSAVSFRAVLVSAGGTVLVLTKPSRIVWQREEALAEISSAVMLDLPLSDLNARIEVEFQESSDNNIVEMFFRRIEAQMQQLQTFALQITNELKEGTLFQKKSKDPLIQDEDMIRDPFNLHKMLVLVTKYGKVLGLDSLTGKIVWQFYRSSLQQNDVKLFTQRTTAHFPHPPQASLVTAQQIITFNPITGKILQEQKHAFKSELLHAVPLPFLDSKYLKPILCLDKDLNVYLHPQTEDVFNKFKNIPHPFFVYLASSYNVSGYKITTDLKAEKIWSVVFPENQYLTALAGKLPNEKIDSIGRPLANRNVIYKYVNPNAIAVVTESIDKNIDNAFITMYVMDAVTGNIIHSAVHKKASSPVHIINSENWLIYTYKSTKTRRYEMMSVEFYEGSSLHNDTAFSSFHVRPEPTVMQQAYILPGRVNALGVSVTEKGLTGRQILFGLSRGSILGFPRRFFDPRRPLKQEPYHKEEGLLQYAPEIPLPTEMLLNYNQTLQRISAIYSATSSLESTSIIFVTGLDLFFTRTQPSKMFDVLKEDFDYILILSVLIGMLAAVVITRKFSQNKVLKRAWK